MQTILHPQIEMYAYKLFVIIIGQIRAYEWRLGTIPGFYMCVKPFGLWVPSDFTVCAFIGNATRICRFRRSEWKEQNVGHYVQYAQNILIIAQSLQDVPLESLYYTASFSIYQIPYVCFY